MVVFAWRGIGGTGVEKSVRFSIISPVLASGMLTFMLFWSLAYSDITCLACPFSSSSCSSWQQPSWQPSCPLQCMGTSSLRPLALYYSSEWFSSVKGFTDFVAYIHRLAYVASASAFWLYTFRSSLTICSQFLVPFLLSGVVLTEMGSTVTYA